jgi:uncharacterized protein YqgV (UPF0045/DUF77 family)
MEITVDISMYPLSDEYVPPIKTFIHQLHKFPGIEIVTNQLSTQLTGEFAVVTTALNACMKESMAECGRVVFVARYLNIGLEINRLPHVD